MIREAVNEAIMELSTDKGTYQFVKLHDGESLTVLKGIPFENYGLRHTVICCKWADSD